MKKMAIAVACLSAVGVSQAEESGLTMYGVVDLAVGYVRHQLNGDPTFPATVNPYTANTATHSLKGMFNGGISDSRLGFKGVENLGGGSKAFFVLESGFDANTGSINDAARALANNGGTATTNAANSSLSGQFFNRQAFVGYSDEKLGSVALGRNYNPIFDVVVQYDPVQAAQLFSPLGFSGTLGGGGGISENTRVDNSVKYGNKFGTYNVGALYKFGEQAGNSSAQSGYALSFGYDDGKLGVQTVYEQFKDGIALGAGPTADTVKATVSNTSSWLISAKYKLDSGLKLKGGFETYTLKKPSDAYATSTLPSYLGQTVGSVSNTSTPARVNIGWAGGDVDVAENLNLGVGFYDVRYLPSGTLTTKSDQYVIAALLDYSLSKRTDTYFGATAEKYNGVKFAGSNPHNGVIAVGIRHRF